MASKLEKLDSSLFSTLNDVDSVTVVGGAQPDAGTYYATNVGTYTHLIYVPDYYDQDV
jgi:hypothetical protein